MRKYEHLIDLKQRQYWQNEERIWAVLRNMTVREIALSSLGDIAKESGVGRNTVYKHRDVYRLIVACREHEAERMRKIQEGGKND